MEPTITIFSCLYIDPIVYTPDKSSFFYKFSDLDVTRFVYLYSG